MSHHKKNKDISWQCGDLKFYTLGFYYDNIFYEVWDMWEYNSNFVQCCFNFAGETNYGRSRY